MITLINKLPEIKAQSAAFARIKCAFAAYSDYPKIALFWEQKSDEGETVALISLLENSLTVYAKEVDEELILFIKTQNFDFIFADEKTAKMLSVQGEKVCALEFFAQGKEKDKNAPNPREIYEILKNEFNLNEYEFIADLSHRLRHNAAFCVLKNEGAAVVQRAGDAALITGICVDNSHRKKGTGSEILKEIKDSFKGEIFVCCKEEVLPFYLKNSFEQIGFCIMGRI